MQRVWPGVVVGDDSLTQAVVEIRRALGDREHQILCTVSRRGYRLQARGSSTREPAPRLSVAVLPIACDAADADGARWAAALTSELTLRAGGGLPDSKVVAREAVAAMGPAMNDPQLAANQLNVQQVVCGELRAVSDGWSVALAVVDGVSGTRRWTHRFAIPHTELPDVIGHVAAQAARALLVEMHRKGAESAAARPLTARDADDLALQGWASFYEGLSPGNLERAQRFFEQAIEKDPSHLRALGGAICTNYSRAEFGWVPDRQQAQQRVIDAASRLAKLYPDATLTALARGDAADIEGRHELRLSIVDRVCQRDSANPSARAARGFALLKLARFDECLAELAEARHLSIEDFRAGWWGAYAACAHLMSNRPGEAAIEAQQAIAINACLPLPPLLLAAALAGDGKSGEGLHVLRQHRLGHPHCDLAHAEMLLGHGNATYLKCRSQILATLEALGVASDCVGGSRS